MTDNTALDGLALLGQQRQKATRKSEPATATPPASQSARRTLQPRHPAPQKPPTAEPVAPAAEPPTASIPRTPPRSRRDAADAEPTRENTEPLIRSTLYLDAELDAWLQQVAGLGRVAMPRIDISRSAVVRYALQQLQATTSTEQVFTELAARATESVSKGGRKRV